MHAGTKKKNHLDELGTLFHCLFVSEKLTANVLHMVMKHNYLFFSISDENKEAWKSLEGEGELKPDSKKKEKKNFERSGGTGSLFCFWDLY